MARVPEVALSMLTLVRGEMGGSENYARALTRELATTELVKAVAYVPGNAAGFSEGIPERVISEVNTRASTVGRLGFLATITVRASQLRRIMSSADVVHFPFTVPLPAARRGTPFVQTLHDVQHLDLPHLFSAAELAYRRVLYEGAAHRADRIITMSHFARERMIDLLGLAPERVTVAHNGVDLERFEANPGAREEFVLYPARGWPHKNHARLIEAMAMVRATRPGMRLVLTGGALEGLGDLPDWVDRRGLVSDQELRNLYRTAAVLAFPSLYEGFGMPPLEAMASGCPVAASSSGAVPEVCGDAAVFFDATDSESIAAGILEAIDRGPILYDRGLAQVLSFSWQRSRDTHVAVYQEVA